jgi:tRNA 2-thiouridine synthesizing protein B
MNLHTLNATPDSPAFADCLRVAAAGDTILLLGNGVYGAIADTAACEQLRATGASIEVLRQDAAAAGVLERVQGATLIDMDDFVALSERYPRQLAWY